MKKEQNALMFSALINVIVSFFKLMGGIFFNCYTLIADGIYTISDFVTDILAIIGAKVGKKRANKKHPFGYGRFEYITQMLIGIIILLVGVYIFSKSFFIEYTKANLNVLYIVILVLLLKVLSSNYLLQKGKEINSLMLTTSAKESFLDVISSFMVIIIIILGQIVPAMDVVGSLLIALLIMAQAVKIIIDNIILLIGEDDNDKHLKKEIKKIIEEYKDIKYVESSLIRNGSYYQATIEIAVNDDITVGQLIQKELRLKSRIRKEKLNIKFIDFDIIKD